MVIDVNLEPTLGSETGKIRPCVIVTNDIYNVCYKTLIYDLSSSNLLLYKFNFMNFLRFFIFIEINFKKTISLFLNFKRYNSK
ncbi:MAG: type II toxin-antitoxin system PemK/MazF family toxin [Desulfobacteraceae bacterium]|nr:type II toxin-antitoxin system PemK/MazF family toxin [Desulfobacteraceae bacterium]